MQFQVPQFIEVEDKIFGPLTFKQFVFVAGGLGTAYLFWRVLPLVIAAPLIAIAGGLAAALAFVQFNGRPFIMAVEHGFFYAIRSKLYLWSTDSRKKAKESLTIPLEDAKSDVYIPHLSESKLHELAWSLDIKERIAAGTASEDEKGTDVVSPIRTPKEVLAHMRRAI